MRLIAPTVLAQGAPSFVALGYVSCVGFLLVPCTLILWGMLLPRLRAKTSTMGGRLGKAAFISTVLFFIWAVLMGITYYAAQYDDAAERQQMESYRQTHPETSTQP